MRISDWSSDVCSSDLPAPEPAPAPAPAPVESASPEPATPEMADAELNLEAETIKQPEAEAVAELTPRPVDKPVQAARNTDRTGRVRGRSVAVSVQPVGGSNM